MQRARNIVLCLVSGVVLLIVALNLAGGRVAGLWDLPTQSDLENRRYQAMPKPRPEALASGSFQSSFESFLADRVPCRNDVLLANARLQRAQIELANLPFGFEAYPSFLESTEAYCPGAQAVYLTPTRASEVDTQGLSREMGESMAALAGARKDMRWRIVVPDSSELSLASPVHDLVADPFDYPKLCQELADALPDNCQFVDVGISDAEAYRQLYFHTDHHMQIAGGAACYQAVMESLGKKPADLAEPYLAFDGQFFGSNARTGLIDAAWDVIYDVRYDLSQVEVLVNGEPAELGEVDQQYANDGKDFVQETRFQSLHGDWFHGNPALIEYRNRALDNGQTLVIIANSFSNNSARFYTSGYERVFELDPRFFEGSIGGFLDEQGANDVVVMLSWESLDTSAIRTFLGK